MKNDVRAGDEFEDLKVAASLDDFNMATTRLERLRVCEAGEREAVDADYFVACSTQTKTKKPLLSNGADRRAHRVKEGRLRPPNRSEKSSLRRSASGRADCRRRRRC